MQEVELTRKDRDRLAVSYHAGGVGLHMLPKKMHHLWFHDHVGIHEADVSLQRPAFKNGALRGKFALRGLDDKKPVVRKRMGGEHDVSVERGVTVRLFLFCTDLLQL